MSRKQVMLVGLILLVMLILVAPESALARAGGGGGVGGGRGGGLWSVILLPFFLIYSGVVTAILARKQREARNLLSRLREHDATWDLDALKGRVEQTFFKVQQAWAERDQDIAREFMSERLYAKHKAQTDEMLRTQRRNVLLDMNLIQTKIIAVKDYVDDSRDRFSAHIKGSMIDYIIDDDGRVVSGSKTETQTFEELWSFVRGDADWVLDEIEQDAGLLDIALLECRSQELKGA